MRIPRLLVLACCLLAGTAASQPFFAPGSPVTRRYDHTATLLPNGKVLLVGGYSNTTDLETAELYDPATGTFAATGSMSTKRYRHTATLLPNGKVLVAGGGSVTTPTYDSAELYDPATGTFTLLGSLMANARYRHTATLLMDGRVLLTAGFDDINGALDTSEIFDPATSSFTPGPTLAAGLRVFHTATLLLDGSVLILGGYSNGFLSSAELYDPVANTFTLLTAHLAFPRYYHTATLLPNGTVLVAGGTNDTGNLKSAEIYTHAPGGGTFAPANGNLAAAREYHSAALLPNGKVLLTGGYAASALSSCEMFDPATGTFSNAGTLADRRENHTSTVLPGGNVLLVGGSNGVTILTNSVLYDPEESAAAAGPAPLSARTSHTATLLPDGRVLVAGGTSGSPLASAELFDPTGPAFAATTGPMTAARSGHTATLLPGGKVLVAGSGSADLFDPATGTFTATLGAMGASRTGHRATLLATGKVLLTGGSSGGTPLSSAEVYDPATDAFAPVPLPMSAARSLHSATLLPNGKVLVAGGAGAGGPLSSAELYDPATNAFTALAATLVAARTSHTATLLPSGKVLLAGGTGGAGSLGSAEVFDPSAGTFTGLPQSLAAARTAHTATLLPGGEVLFAGGTGTVPLTSLEVFTPATGRFATVATGLSTARSGHQATLLFDGRVLVTGGAASATSDRVSPGLGVEGRRPVLTAAPSAIGQPGSLTLGGTGFLGDSEGGPGASLGSAENLPVVRIQRIEGELVTYALPDPTQPSTATAFASLPLSGLPGGHYRVTLFTLGLQSQQKATGVTSLCATPPASPVAGNSGPICAGSNLQLTASTVPGATYLWTGPSGFSSSQQNPLLLGAGIAASGTYTVIAVVGGCPSAPATTNAVVNAIPSAPTAGSNSPLCAGSQLNLSASSVPGATYAWTGPAGFTSSSQNPTIPSATAAATGTYSVTVTLNGCTSPAGSTSVVVNASPSAPTAGNGGPICTGQTLTLSASTIPGATYAWTGPAGFTSGLQNPIILGATSLASGTYSVVATVSGCPSAPATTTATVNTYPLATITAPGTVCPGSTGLIASVPDAGEGTTYAWTITGGTITGGAGTRTITWTAGASGQATLGVQVTLSGCPSSDSKDVTISSSLDTTITADASVCSSSTGHTASAPDAGSGATYAWTIAGGTFQGSTTGRTVTYTAGAAGTLTLGVTVSSGGCGSIGSQNVTVQDGSAAPVVTPPNPASVTVDQSACVGGVPGATLATLATRFPPQASLLGNFLNLDAAATDDCGKLDRLPTRLGADDVVSTTLFPTGSSTVTFRFGDISGNVGTATGTVHVRRLGDTDADGDVDVFDVVTLAAYIVGNVQAEQPPFLAPASSGDVDGNGVIDVFDLILLQAHVVGNVPCLTP